MPIKDLERANQLLEGIRQMVTEKSSTITIINCSIVNDLQKDRRYLKVHFKRLGTAGSGELTDTVLLDIADPIPTTLTALGEFMDTPSVLNQGTPASGKIEGQRQLVCAGGERGKYRLNDHGEQGEPHPS